MRLLRLTARQLADLATANTKIRNVILVPFCIEGRAGTFVEYDHLDSDPALVRISTDDHTLFDRHRRELGTIDTRKVIEASEIPDRVARVVRVVVADARVVEEEPDARVADARVADAEEPLERESL